MKNKQKVTKPRFPSVNLKIGFIIFLVLDSAKWGQIQDDQRVHKVQSIKKVQMSEKAQMVPMLNMVLKTRKISRA